MYSSFNERYCSQSPESEAPTAHGVAQLVKAIAFNYKDVFFSLAVKPQLKEEGGEDLANITIDEDKDALNEFLADELAETAQTGVYTKYLFFNSYPEDMILPSEYFNSHSFNVAFSIYMLGGCIL